MIRSERSPELVCNWNLANVRSDADGIGCCSNGEYQFAGVQLGGRTQHKSRRLQLLETRRLNFDGVVPGYSPGAENSPLSDVVTVRVSPLDGLEW